MASGDTIGGSIRVLLEDTQGNRNVVIGDLSQSQVDGVNESRSPDEEIYFNTGLSGHVTAPGGAQKRTARNAVFEPGEKVVIQHESNDDNSRDIDRDGDYFDIDIIRRDMNRDNSYTGKLTASHQELTGTVAESDDGYVDIYETTVPDRMEIYIAGVLNATAVEN